ncbi:2-Hydroxyacid oxidase 1-like isoform X3 [Hydractinia symbiolongicarpus]|uniref:2-Hydroxyacid oxidase 1-like isoform X3 n=1 Tax=Hydractinia symbiolongicarpus TaxID=13093 RepID=UPI002551780F|nr:2-Hydroxyacid oxidase 1-like isoform X3 [Hydractinia symbiolongicarpus]
MLMVKLELRKVVYLELLLHRFRELTGINRFLTAAAKFRSCMAVSSFSTTPFEELSKAAPNSIFWSQAYIYKDNQVTIDFVQGIENAGYQAIVLTVDTATRKLNKYQKMRDLLASKNERIYTEVLTDDAVKVAVSWSDVDWLRTVTKLPILLKGILTREDALEALKHDVQGIIVSNHGGRQLDGVSSTIEALPEIVHAVNGKMDVYLDGGIRKGTDVFKALALGAKAVFFGRPAIYGLAYNGKEGVEKVFQMLKDEFERAMLLAGCASLADITPDMVVHESYYWKLPNHKL